MSALFQLLSGCLSEEFQHLYADITEAGGGGFGSQVFCLEIAVIEAVEQEIQQIRHYGLRTFRFQQLHEIIIGKRGELHKDFSYNSHSGFLQVLVERKVVKIADDSPHIFLKGSPGRIFAGNRVNASGFPFSVKLIGRSGSVS